MASAGPFHHQTGAPAVTPGLRRQAILIALPVGALLLFTSSSLGGQTDSASGFDACEERVRTEPPGYDPYVCFYWEAARSREWDEAARRLDRLRTTDDTAWPTLVRAHIDFLGRGEAEAARPLYEEAAERFQAEREPLGEVLARFNLRGIHMMAGEDDLVAREVELALAAAQAGDSDEAKLRALILEADHLMRTGGGMDKTYRSLREAKQVAFPEGPLGLQTTVLRQLALVAFDLGFTDEAIDTYQQLLELKRANGDTTEEALVLFNILNARLRQQVALPQPAKRASLILEAEAALSRAEELDDPTVAARLEGTLGDLLSKEDPERARTHYLRCFELAREHDLGAQTSGFSASGADVICAQSFARNLADTFPDEARAHALKVTEQATASENDLDLSYVWEARQRTAFAALPRDEAIVEALSGLNAIERLRADQTAEGARIAMFSTWTRTYHWLAGTLLALDRPEVATAFEVVERMRGRSLLERVDHREPADSARQQHGEDERRSRLEHIRTEIASVQRQLLDSELDPEGRSRLTASLEQLELEEAELAGELETDVRTATQFDPITLAELQQSLRPKEAMLSFAVGVDEDIYGGFGGGGFVFVMTSASVETFNIPDRTKFAASVPVFVGLLSSNEERMAARRAFATRLLGPALESLPEDIERLILVPDGPLHHLPFSALPLGDDDQPLGLRFELSTVPSATLWSLWRQENRGPTSARPLILADPDPGFTTSKSLSTTRSALLAQGLEAGRLPYARREGRNILKVLGRGELWLDGAASEHELKAIALDDFGLLHFAAHAFADESRPGRAGILLAPGDPSEDGLLQSREILELGLDRKMVALSACQTAAGAAISGEGVLSLARSFFAGGATTVIASRWPLRDDHAALLFEWFYRALAEGANASGALLDARQRAVDRGLPAESWAGVVLLGSGDYALSELPGGRWTTPSRMVEVVILAAIVLVVGALLRRRRAPGT